MEILPKTTKQDNKPKMAYSRNAFTREQQKTKKGERDSRETKTRHKRDSRPQLKNREGWSYGLWPIIV